MITQIKKIGNSKGIVIPAPIIKMFDLKEAEELTLKVEGKQIILTKADIFDPKSLEELFIGYKGTYQSDIIFDDAEGREVW